MPLQRPLRRLTIELIRRNRRMSVSQAQHIVAPRAIRCSPAATRCSLARSSLRVSKIVVRIGKRRKLRRSLRSRLQAFFS